MLDPSRRQHGLEGLLKTLPATEQYENELRVEQGTGFMNLRGNPADAAFAEAVNTVLELELPATSNTFTADSRRLYWLGPDEWLAVVAAEDAPALCQQLASRLGSIHAAVNDVSGAGVALRLRGSNARNLLAKGCTLDLHPRSFTPGMCAQSGLAKAGILLGLVDETPDFEIIVRRSYADYLARWLLHTGRHDILRFV